MKRIAMFIGLLLVCTSAQAYKIILPPKEVARIAATLAYPDFPTKRDILAICRVESAYNPKAVNPEISKKYPHRKRKPSNGIMQVQNGSMDMYTNMIQGVAKLRENYVRLRSREGAVKAYNIGLTAYLKGRAKISAEDYWTKFKKREAELILYAETGNLNVAGLSTEKQSMRDLRSISIKVELFAGSDIRDACCDVCELANRMGCLIEASFNGVRLWAREGSNPLTLADAYEKELISKSAYKVAKGW